MRFSWPRVTIVNSTPTLLFAASIRGSPRRRSRELSAGAESDVWPLPTSPKLEVLPTSVTAPLPREELKVPLFVSVSSAGELKFHSTTVAAAMGKGSRKQNATIPQRVLLFLMSAPGQARHFLQKG